MRLDTSLSMLDHMISKGYRGGKSREPNARGVSSKMRTYERQRYLRRQWTPHMCCMGEHGSRVSVAFSVWCLIADYHSIMDCWPRHADWEAVY